MTSSPIVTADWLAERLLDPTIKVIEVSSKKEKMPPIPKVTFREPSTSFGKTCAGTILTGSLLHPKN